MQFSVDTEHDQKCGTQPEKDDHCGSHHRYLHNLSSGQVTTSNLDLEALLVGDGSHATIADITVLLGAGLF
jgi:hypothetical protein